MHHSRGPAAGDNASATRTCSSQLRGFTPVVEVNIVLSMDMSGGDATPLSTDAAGTGTTFASDNPITVAAEG